MHVCIGVDFIKPDLNEVKHKVSLSFIHNGSGGDRSAPPPQGRDRC